MYVKSDISENFDLREYKKNLRSEYKQMRMDMPEYVKCELDQKICGRFLSTSIYKDSEVLLTYVSTSIEVDTKEIISLAIQDGKTVAVPKCIDGTRDMEFYIIKSLDDLEPGAFSVLEPSVEKCQPLFNFNKAVCIVPALAYDMDGYRLGYGKGYYDRYLSVHPELYNVGIEYCCCTSNKLIRGKFDKAVNMLITEKYIKNLR